MKDFIITMLLIFAMGKAEGKGNYSSNEDDELFKVYIRLRGSSLPYAGRVEVSNNGEVWGTVCDKDWNIKDARVVCRQLDFSFTEAAVPMAGFGTGSGSIFLKDVKCKGFEQSLLKCQHDGWKTHDVNVSCDHSMDTGVVCRPHKERLQIIVFIVVACLLVISYVLNIWFIYYVCCKQRRRKKRHLTAVQQRAITRRKGSQEGLDNEAIDSEGCVDLSTTTVKERKKQESPKLQRNGVHPTHSEPAVSREDGPTSTAYQQEQQQQHVYQRLQSCLLDPSSREYLEILESLPERPANQLPEMHASEQLPRVTGYQSISPQAAENKQISRKGDEDRYEQLLLRNMSSEKAHAPSACKVVEEYGNTDADQIPDYVEIIGHDNSLAGNTMARPTSPAVTTNVKNPYETLKPAQDPSHRVQGNSSCSAHVKDQQSSRAENEVEEEAYVELLPENEAGVKETNSTVDHENTYESMSH